jgi:uncharacterized protein YbjT (DUF2867 family)
VTNPALRGQVLELGGPDNLTFDQLAAIIAEVSGSRGTIRHVPRQALRAIAWLTAGT